MSGGFVRAPVWKIAARKLGDTPSGGDSLGPPHWSWRYSQQPGRYYAWGTTRQNEALAYTVDASWLATNPGKIVTWPMFFPASGVCETFFRHEGNGAAGAAIRFALYANGGPGDPRPDARASFGAPVALTAGAPALLPTGLGALTIAEGSLWWLAMQLDPPGVGAVPTFRCNPHIGMHGDPFVGLHTEAIEDTNTLRIVEGPAFFAATNVYAAGAPATWPIPTSSEQDIGPSVVAYLPTVFIRWSAST